jgi:hypothetical protein
MIGYVLIDFSQPTPGRNNRWLPERSSPRERPEEDPSAPAKISGTSSFMPPVSNFHHPGTIPADRTRPVRKSSAGDLHPPAHAPGGACPASLPGGTEGGFSEGGRVATVGRAPAGPDLAGVTARRTGRLTRIITALSASIAETGGASCSRSSAARMPDIGYPARRMRSSHTSPRRAPSRRSLRRHLRTLRGRGPRRVATLKSGGSCFPGRPASATAGRRARPATQSPACPGEAARSGRTCRRRTPTTARRGSPPFWPDSPFPR